MSTPSGLSTAPSMSTSASRCASSSSPQRTPAREAAPSGKFDQFARCSSSEKANVAASRCTGVERDEERIWAAATIASVRASAGSPA